MMNTISRLFHTPACLFVYDPEQCSKWFSSSNITSVGCLDVWFPEDWCCCCFFSCVHCCSHVFLFNLFGFVRQMGDFCCFFVGFFCGRGMVRRGDGEREMCNWANVYLVVLLLCFLLLQCGPEWYLSFQLALHVTQPVLHLTVTFVKWCPLHQRHLQAALHSREVVIETVPAQFELAQLLSDDLTPVRGGAAIQALSRVHTIVKLGQASVSVTHQILVNR